MQYSICPNDSSQMQKRTENAIRMNYIIHANVDIQYKSGQSTVHCCLSRMQKKKKRKKKTHKRKNEKGRPASSVQLKIKIIVSIKSTGQLNKKEFFLYSVDT